MRVMPLLPIAARNPDYVQVHSRLSGAYASAGRHAEAIAAAETANRLAGDSAARNRVAAPCSISVCH